MRILIVGNGGREHTLLWKLRQDAPEAEFFATRPNGGMAGLCNGIEVAPSDVDVLASWAADANIDLTVIGPEGPLAAGLADSLDAVGVPAFGPSAAAARIEASKAFAKDLMARAGVPTAAYEVHSEVATAESSLAAMGAPVVVKASGLAAGKGAVVCHTVEEANHTARKMLGGAFGSAGNEIVIEEFMEGEELSLFYLTDGEKFVPMLPSQDHKTIGEGDTGPNTGGMGAYSPVSIVSKELMDTVGRTIVAPVLGALAEARSPFRGLLYAGLMITEEGPKVVEFNCRFGDPETQVVVPLLASSLLKPMLAIAQGDSLPAEPPAFLDQAAVTTVLAAQGYPGPSKKGEEVLIPPLPDGVHIFHAGTERQGDRLFTAGGRVLAVTALADSFEDARTASRDAASAISFTGKQFRTDIGWREAERRQAAMQQ